MTYDFAKKLKDAGFPQTLPPEGSAWYVFLEGKISRFAISSFGNEGGETQKELNEREVNAKVPTLSELIEACGDSLGDLTRTNTGWSTNAENIGNYPQTEGSTPEEAVANLWLELNKK